MAISTENRHYQYYIFNLIDYQYNVKVKVQTTHHSGHNYFLSLGPVPAYCVYVLRHDRVWSIRMTSLWTCPYVLLLYASGHEVSAWFWIPTLLNILKDFQTYYMFGKVHSNYTFLESVEQEMWTGFQNTMYLHPKFGIYPGSLSNRFIYFFKIPYLTNHTFLESEEQ